MKKMDKLIIAGIGIAGITALEAMAMYTGQDGSMLATAIGAIATIVGGVIGYSVGTAKGEG
jgi:hypothetical protein